MKKSHEFTFAHIQLQISVFTPDIKPFKSKFSYRQHISILLMYEKLEIYRKQKKLIEEDLNGCPVVPQIMR